MKALTTKILSIVFIFALISGCASVTDAGLQDANGDLSSDANIEAPNPDAFGDAEVKPIIIKPEGE
ncbi:MAG: hypothetical protein U5K31_05820 [Balneolaceae bacterium]|nr:hypothetical protein [Balneolaceae bacterium]